MTTAINRLENGTIELTLTIPWEDVKKAKEAALLTLTKQAQVPGFRKGKAPKKLVEEKVDPQKVHEQVLKELLPKAVSDAIVEHKINPIFTPEVHLREMAEGKDWQFVARTCEVPEIILGDYKDAIKKVTAKSKIILPGKESEPPKLDDVVKAVLESVKIQVPQLLIDHEVDRLLSQLLTEVKSLGLSLDRYLQSTGKTSESLRQEYEKRAIDDIKLELALQKIAETEGITVEEKDIDEAIEKIKDEKERTAIAQNRYLLARLIRQQKTLDFLAKL